MKEAMKQIIAEIDALPEGLKGYFSDAFADNLAKVREALAQPEQEPVVLREALREALTATYVCGRVWSAWNVGTMTEDDFQPAADCDELLDSLIEAVAIATPPAQPLRTEQEPVAVDQDTMELAEIVGLIGPASRTHDLHNAIQRFHDLICANATIKAAVAFSRTLEAKDEPVAWRWHQAPVKTSWGHDMVVADLAIDKDNTVSVYCERDQTAKVEAMFNTPPTTQPAPVQEPVGTVNVETKNNRRTYQFIATKRLPDGVLDVYTTPPAQPAPVQPEQEPCDMGNICAGCSPRNADGSCPHKKPNLACDCYVKGFNEGMKELEPDPTPPAQPQRKPLTNGEIYTAYITATNQTLRATDERLAFAFARAIEAAHGIKEIT